MMLMQIQTPLWTGGKALTVSWEQQGSRAPCTATTTVVRAAAHVGAEKPGLTGALAKAGVAVGTGLSILALSALLNVAPGLTSIAHANEFNVLNDGPPSEAYVVDDASVLNRVTKSDLKRLLADLEERKGYHINVITLRKLTSKADSFEFADAVNFLLNNCVFFCFTSFFCALSAITH